MTIDLLDDCKADGYTANKLLALKVGLRGFLLCSSFDGGNRKLLIEADIAEVHARIVENIVQA